MRMVNRQLLMWGFSLTLLICGVLRSNGWSQSESSGREISLYSFKYLGITVAHGAITISDTLTDDGRPAKRIEARATSLSSTSFLFKINNRYITTVDAETGYPTLYEKDIEQSNFSQKSRIRFDQKHRRVYGSEVGEVLLPTSVHCFFSALYYVRNHSFQPKEVVCLPVYAAGSAWDVRAKALTTKKIITPAGAYQTVLIEIDFKRSASLHDQKIDTDVLTNRLVGEGKKTHIWISTGQKHTVIKGEYELFPTGLQMILAEHRQ